MSQNNKKKISQRYIGRRQFLIGAGNFMLTLPPLLSMMPSKVMAQVINNRKVRVFTFVNVYGIDPHQLYPDDYISLNETNNPNINQIDLTSLPNQISRIVDFNDSDLNGLQTKMNLMKGLGLTGGNYAGHNHSILSGTHSGGRSPTYGESIDVLIERALGVKALRIATTSSSWGKAHEFSFARDAGGNRTIKSLTYGDGNLFRTLFPGGMPPGQVTDNQNTRDKSVVDKVIEDLNVLQNHQRISQNDKNILSDYMDGVNDLQKRIIANANSAPPPASCTTPNMNFQVQTNQQSMQSVDQLYNNYSDLMVIAALCDNARVFHIANTAISNLNSNAAHPELHHDCTGGSNGNADRNKWLLKHAARLAKKLDATQDPYDTGRSLLDNSVVFFTNELGTWSTAHSVTQIPSITFGSGGGYFRTGKFIDFRQRPFLRAKGNSSSGRSRDLGHPYKQLLVSIMRAAGLQRNDYINSGDGNGFGEFKAQLNGANSDAVNHYAQFASSHNDPLPYVSLGG